MTILLFIAVALLAYSNGANDNFKGVASLFGSRTSTYRTALAWATLTTFAGSVCSIFLARSLLLQFSGKGLVPDALVGSEVFLLAADTQLNEAGDATGNTRKYSARLAAMSTDAMNCSRTI
jgi:PiT family inorganic phosphate transporter